MITSSLSGTPWEWGRLSHECLHKIFGTPFLASGICHVTTLGHWLKGSGMRRGTCSLPGSLLLLLNVITIIIQPNQGAPWQENKYSLRLGLATWTPLSNLFVPPIYLSFIGCSTYNARVKKCFFFLTWNMIFSILMEKPITRLNCLTSTD